jgi:hypothetical protein
MLKVTIRKNGVIVPSVTTTEGRVIYTTFEEPVTFTSDDQATMEYTWEESREIT